MGGRQSTNSFYRRQGIEGSQDRVQLCILQGSVADQKADVLVNSVNVNLDLASGAISSALFRKAGGEMQREIKQRYPHGIQEFGIAITRGFNLSCRKVFHVACREYTSPASLEKLFDVIYHCLIQANEMGMTSITFPVIGIGQLGYQVRDVAGVYCRAVSYFDNTVTSGHLKKISCIAFDRDTFKVFQSLNPEPNSSAVAIQNGSRTGFTVPPVIRRERLPLQDCDHVTVCGISGADISAAHNRHRTMDGFKFVHEYDAHDEVKCREGDAKYSNVDGHDSNVSQKNTNKQKDLSGGTRGASNEHPMSIVHENELRQSSTLSDVGRQREIHVGPAEPSAYTAQSVSSEERQPSTDLHYGTSGSSYPGTGDSRTAPSWINDPSDDTGIIERMQKLKETSKEQLYPTNWQISESESITCIVLDRYHYEYRQVISSFHGDRKYQPARFLKVNQVIRIQDKTLWQQYSAQKDKIKRNCPENYEQKLWCYCSAEDVDALLKSRTPPLLFNRSSSSCNEYGCGSYFFRDPLRAATASGSMLSGSGPSDKYIVQATVLTGHYILGNSSMKTLPQRSDSDSKYDSSVDDMMDPTTFVVYHDAQAYPLYAVKLA